MLSFRVHRVGQALGNDVVAEGDAMRGALAPFLRRLTCESRTRGRQVLVGGPGQRTMVDDDVPGRDGRNGVVVAARKPWASTVSGPDPYVPDHHVVRGNIEAAADQRDARRRGGLAGNS